MADLETYNIGGPDFELKLTPLDQRRPLVYPRSLFLYQLQPGHSQDHIIKILRVGLSRVIHRVPWLGTRLHFNPDPTKLTTEPAIPKRADMQLTVRRSVPGLHYKTLTPDQLTPQLAPARPQFPPGPQTDLYGFRVQLNFIEGDGLIIGWTYSHCLSDGATHVEMIIKLLAFECMSAQLDGLDTPRPNPPLLPWVLDRSVLQRRAPLPELPDPKISSTWILPQPMQALAPNPNAPKTLDKTFKIGRATIESFRKQAVSKDVQLGGHDIACALIWRSVMAARAAAGVIDGDEEVAFGMPVDMRRFLPKGVTQYGNVVTGMHVRMPFTELQGQDGVVLAADKIRRELQSFKPKIIDDVVDLHSTVPDLRLMAIKGAAEIFSTFVFVTSLYGFVAYEYDWGPALKYDTLRKPITDTPDGMGVVFPRPRDGGFEVQFTLREDVCGKWEEVGLGGEDKVGKAKL